MRGRNGLQYFVSASVGVPDLWQWRSNIVTQRSNEHHRARAGPVCRGKAQDWRAGIGRTVQRPSNFSASPAPRPLKNRRYYTCAVQFGVLGTKHTEKTAGVPLTGPSADRQASKGNREAADPALGGLTIYGLQDQQAAHRASKGRHRGLAVRSAGRFRTYTEHTQNRCCHERGSATAMGGRRTGRERPSPPSCLAPSRATIMMGGRSRPRQERRGMAWT